MCASCSARGFFWLVQAQMNYITSSLDRLQQQKTTFIYRSKQKQWEMLCPSLAPFTSRLQKSSPSQPAPKHLCTVRGVELLLLILSLFSSSHCILEKSLDCFYCPWAYQQATAQERMALWSTSTTALSALLAPPSMNGEQQAGFEQTEFSVLFSDPVGAYLKDLGFAFSFLVWHTSGKSKASLPIGMSWRCRLNSWQCFFESTKW